MIQCGPPLGTVRGMGRLKRWRENTLDVVGAFVPGVDLVNDVLDRNEYKLRRVTTVPPGWRAAEALVDEVELHGTSGGGGRPDEAAEIVAEVTVTYVVLEPQGGLRSLSERCELFGSVVPTRGRRLTLAVDRAGSGFAVLEDHKERKASRTAQVRDLARNGSGGRATVQAVTPTGRVARPPEIGAPVRSVTAPWARKKRAAAPPPMVVPISPREALGVPGPAPARRRLRGRPHVVGQGRRDRGRYGGVVPLRRRRPPDEGYPIFPTAEHRTGRGDPVERARDELVKALGRG